MMFGILNEMLNYVLSMLMGRVNKRGMKSGQVEVRRAI